MPLRGGESNRFSVLVGKGEVGRLLAEVESGGEEKSESHEGSLSTFSG